MTRYRNETSLDADQLLNERERELLSRRLSSSDLAELSSGRQLKRIRRTLTFLNLNRKRAGNGVPTANFSKANRRLSLGIPLSTPINHHHHHINSPANGSKLTFSANKKKAIKASTKENLGTIKQQLKKFGEASSMRVMKRKSMMASSRTSKRRELLNNIGMTSFLGWDADLREYIENPKYLSRVSESIISIWGLYLTFYNLSRPNNKRGQNISE